MQLFSARVSKTDQELQQVCRCSGPILVQVSGTRALQDELTRPIVLNRVRIVVLRDVILASPTPFEDAILQNRNVGIRVIVTSY